MIGYINLGILLIVLGFVIGVYVHTDRKIDKLSDEIKEVNKTLSNKIDENNKTLNDSFSNDSFNSFGNDDSFDSGRSGFDDDF